MTNGNATYRFLSFNIPNLHVLEDPYWHRITRWEQEDLLDAVSEMGGQVVRIYAFSIQGPKETTEALKHFRWVNGAWSLNEDLFKDLDQALVLAREHNIRLIVPLIDNWDFWGGIPSFVARQSVSSSSEFYTNPRLRSSFKSMISLVLERRNSLSGIPYKVDPTIMAWETGNELMMNNGRVPYEWTSDIVKHIKSLDPNHLVMDGTFGKVGWEPAALSDPAIDIFSGHYYPMELNTRQIVALSFMGTFTLIILAAIGYASCFPSKLKLSKGFRALEKRNSVSFL